MAMTCQTRRLVMRAEQYGKWRTLLRYMGCSRPACHPVGVGRELVPE